MYVHDDHRGRRTIERDVRGLLGSVDIATYYRGIGRWSRERLILCATDDTGALCYQWFSSPGTENEILLDPTDLPLPSVGRYGATRACILHNHPSYCATPSATDFEATRTMLKLRPADVVLVDHIIICRGGGYFCFKGLSLAGIDWINTVMVTPSIVVAL